VDNNIILSDKRTMATEMMMAQNNDAADTDDAMMATK